jgi:hypothetical protein
MSGIYCTHTYMSKLPTYDCAVYSVIVNVHHEETDMMDDGLVTSPKARTDRGGVCVLGEGPSRSLAACGWTGVLHASSPIKRRRLT